MFRTVIARGSPYGGCAGARPSQCAAKMAAFHTGGPQFIAADARVAAVGNAGRFPDGFMFQLTKEEFAELRSQNVTSNKVSRSDVAILRSQIVTSKRGGLRS